MTRFIFSDNGVLSDITVEMNDYKAQVAVLPIVAAQDFIFIGSDLPLSNLHIEMSVVNDQTSEITPQIWWNDQWRDAVDVLDRTKSSGKTLSQSGVLSFQPNKDYGWDLEDKSSDVTGLTGTNIYDMYWCRLKFSANLKNTTAIKYIGQKFATDSDLYVQYPDLNNSAMKLAFEAAKTTWDTQHFESAKQIIRYMRQANMIVGKEQIHEIDLFIDPAVHKCAELIYRALGKDYYANSDKAKQAFVEAMRLKFSGIDSDMDGKYSLQDKFNCNGKLFR